MFIHLISPGTVGGFTCSFQLVVCIQWDDSHCRFELSDRICWLHYLCCTGQKRTVALANGY